MVMFHNQPPLIPPFSEWDIQNLMVMAWLINSMDESIAEIYLLYPSTKSIRDAVALAYSDLEDATQMFHLRTRARNLKQAESSVTHYFNSFTKLWQELDLFNQPSWKDLFDADVYKKMFSKDCIYDFIASLKSSLDDVGGRILSLKPLPVIEVIFAEIRREEHRRKIMLGPSSISGITTLPSKVSAMVARHSDSKG